MAENTPKTTEEFENETEVTTQKETEETTTMQTKKGTQELMTEVETSSDIDKLSRQIRHTEFISKYSKNERLKYVTQPSIDSKELKKGTEITFNFKSLGTENRDLFLNTTAGQVLPREVREIEHDGIIYHRDSIDGEFFRIEDNKYYGKRNTRLRIYTGTKINVTKYYGEEELNGKDGKGGLLGEYDKKYQDYVAQNKEHGFEEKILRKFIELGIDPKIGSEVLKGKSEAEIEEFFTDFDRIRGINNFDRYDKNGNPNKELNLAFLYRLYGDKYESEAKKIGYKEEELTTFKKQDLSQDFLYRINDTVETSSNVVSKSIADYIEKHANYRSTGYCLRYVKFGLAAGVKAKGGKDGASKEQWPGGHAKQYGNFGERVHYENLLKSRLGYEEIKDKNNYSPKIGDLVVFDAPKGPGGGNRVSGHIQVLTKRGRASDFIQRNFMPGRKYQNTPFKIFRIA